MRAVIEDLPPRILFIDAYDSFTYNIVSLVETTLNVEVTVARLDDAVEDLATFLKPFAAVIAGPGPGNPSNPKDTGIFPALWTLGPHDMIPSLGICLGFQSLILAGGGQVMKLPEPRHGMLRKVRTCGTSLFAGIDEMTVVQYHSLYAELGDMVNHDGPRDIALQDEKFQSRCPELDPLAWDFDIDNCSDNLGLQRNNPQAILMGVAHRSKPFYGVQFHPESICSDKSCQKILPNWWTLVQQWNRKHRFAKMCQVRPHKAVSNGFYKESSISQDATSWRKSGRSVEKSSATHPPNTTHKTNEVYMNENSSYDPRRASGQSVKGPIESEVISRHIDASYLTVPSICEHLGIHDGEVIILDSERNQRPQTGKHSIIGVVAPNTVKLEYNVGDSHVRYLQHGKVRMTSLQAHQGSIFMYLKHFMNQRKAQSGSPDVPFWGGLVGYITYEACLETLDICGSPNPVDLGFAYIERSIVIDHVQGRLYVQSITPNDHDWVSSTAETLSNRLQPANDYICAIPTAENIKLPTEVSYKCNIRQCQEYLRSGDSYELCLTTQSQVNLPTDLSAWALYQRLRVKNPAPFAAYVRLGPLTHVSSSPERFFSWTRPARQHSPCQYGHTNGNASKGSRKSSLCQFRPIKGTVKRQPDDPEVPPVTLEQATAILSTPKERAENLMIVDLIRHDLHGVVGSDNVHVPKLMVVEEYATLFQLVTVVEGTLYVDDDSDEEYDNHGNGTSSDQSNIKLTNSEAKSDINGVGYEKGFPSNGTIHAQQQATSAAQKSNSLTGIDVLAASLPPGSMTGAPKRRSCSILQRLENRNRGVYSGVLGYMDVGGGGDFSVIIRSAFSWDSDKKPPSSSSTFSSTAHNGGSAHPHFDSQSLNGHCINGHSDTNMSTSAQPQSDMNGHYGSHRTWTIGAGGAVTCLSTEAGEWEEMQGKLSSTMSAFMGDPSK